MSPCSGTQNPAPYVTFSWDAVNGQYISYRVQIFTDAQLTNLAASQQTSSASTQISTLQSGTTYWWRVGVNTLPTWDSGYPNFSYGGSVCSFTTSVATQVPQVAPEVYAPGNNEANIATSTLLGWTSVGGASQYQIQVTTTQGNWAGATTTTVTSGPYELAPLAVGTSYWWRVRAGNSIGWADWSLSEVHRFDTRSAVTTVNAYAYLQGPLITSPSVSMSDALRSGGHIPEWPPYYYSSYGLSNYSSVTPAQLSVTGNTAIVDWVVLQARHGTTNAPVKSWVMLLRRDGSMVKPDGSALSEALPMRTMRFSVHHRNHLGAMIANSVNAAGTPLTVDFRTTSTALHGTNPTYISGSTRALWAGDCNGDGSIKYTGSGNDRDLVLSAIGGSVPTNTVTGYFREDVNMDGISKYTGSNNDRDIILSVIGGVVPTNSRVQQLP